MEEVELHIGFWWENRKKRDNEKDLGVDGRMELKLISYKWDGEWNELILLRDRDNS